MLYVVANMSYEQKVALSHSKEDLIRMCVFNRQQCDIDRYFQITSGASATDAPLYRDFIIHVDPIYGNCYVFNYDAKFNKTSRAGPVFGK